MTEQPSLNDRYRVALEAAQIGIWTWHHTEGVIVWDDEAAALIGAGPETRLTLADLVGLAHPDDREAVRTCLDAALDPAGRGVLAIEARSRAGRGYATSA